MVTNSIRIVGLTNFGWQTRNRAIQSEMKKNVHVYITATKNAKKNPEEVVWTLHMKCSKFEF